jgi:hypothetical protein
MYSIEQISELFGDEALNYLSNKNRGGTSGSKGNTYENFFAVYQLAVLAKDFIEHQKDAKISSQLLAFVDALIVDRQQEHPLQHYQLKNSPTVAWNAGSHPIAEDFRKQYHLNHACNRTSDLKLVVSNESCKDSLDTTMPIDLTPFSQVLHFPYNSSLLKVVQQNSDFQASIEYLCAFENPAPDKIECVAIVLLGAWVSTEKSNASVAEILQKAQEFTPSYVRSFRQDIQLDPQVKQILDAIDHFTYNLTKGFLHWKFHDGLSEGILPYRIDTARFERFQETIKKHRPTTFDDLEGFL